MRRADFLQTFVHDALGEFGFVALAAEMAEIQITQLGGHDFLRCFGSGFVGKMSVTAKDSLLEAPRTARTVLQHFHVMIGFEHQCIGGSDAFEHQLGRMAKVGKKTNVRPVRAQQKPHRILGIVRNGKCFNKNVANFKAHAGAEKAEGKFALELKLNFFSGGAVAVNRDVQFLCQRAQAGDVVTVFVCDENAGQIFRRAANGGEPLSNLTEAEARIHEDARLGGFHIGAIAIGAAAQNRQVNSHNGR